MLKDTKLKEEIKSKLDEFYGLVINQEDMNDEITFDVGTRRVHVTKQLILDVQRVHKQKWRDELAEIIIKSAE